jgi:hypothetical protein
VARKVQTISKRIGSGRTHPAAASADAAIRSAKGLDIGRFIATSPAE